MCDHFIIFESMYSHDPNKNNAPENNGREIWKSRTEAMPPIR